MEEEHDFFLAEPFLSFSSPWFTAPRFLLVLSGVLVTRKGAGRRLLNDEDGESGAVKSELVLRILLLF